MFVVDASVVACWYFPDESHPIADAASLAITKGSATTPELFWFELRNLLLVGERVGRISEIETARFLRFVDALPIEIDHQPDEGLVLSLARTHKLTVYNAAYLEMALRRMLPLATLDKSIVRAAKAERVPLIGNLES
jgi:predicted nucleic acid-binding protein